MSDKKENWLEGFLSENVVGILVGVLCIAVFAGWWVTRSYFAKFGALGSDAAAWGQLGDYLGGVLNPIFGFLSVFALLVALVLQTRELKLSRESLRLSQEELKLTREEQAKAAGALAAQNKAIQKQSFEQTFFAWLGTYRQILSEISYSEEQGRDALRFIWQHALASEYISGWDSYLSHGESSALSGALVSLQLNSLEEVEAGHRPVISRAAKEAWEVLYKEHETKLDSFYRVLYRLFKWIEEQPREFLGDREKWLYAGIVRSQLSWIEMVFLFYNGMTDRGAKFKPLIERYALFDNLTVESDHLLIILKECPMDVVGYGPSAFNSDEARKGEAVEQ